MGQIFLGLIILAGGLFLVIKTEWLLENFGRIAWFEAKLSAEGGSRLGYKLLGLTAILIGVIVMTGSGSDFMSWVVSPLVRHN